MEWWSVGNHRPSTPPIHHSSSPLLRFMKKQSALNDLLKIMARLRSPGGCPWDREQDHMSLRWHAVEEVYEMVDAIEAGDDQELEEELGDLLLQVVFHSQLARERGAFDFEKVARHIADKLVRRHPHVFGDEASRAAGNRADVDAAVEGSSAAVPERTKGGGSRALPAVANCCWSEPRLPLRTTAEADSSSSR